jgi:hypothetical protein
VYLFSCIKEVNLKPPFFVCASRNWNIFFFTGKGGRLGIILKFQIRGATSQLALSYNYKIKKKKMSMERGYIFDMLIFYPL